MHELLPEKLGAAGVGIEEGVQCLEDPVLAVIRTKSRFNAPDGYDIFAIDADFGLDPVEQRPVLPQFLFSRGNDRRGNEQRPVIVIWFGLPLLIHQFEDLFVDGHTVKDRVEFLLGKLMFVPQFLKELAIVVFLQVNLLPVDNQVRGLRLLLCRGEGLAGQEQCQDQESSENMQMKMVINSENWLTSYG